MLRMVKIFNRKQIENRWVLADRIRSIAHEAFESDYRSNRVNVDVFSRSNVSPIGIFKHGSIQKLLASIIMIDHGLAVTGGRGDLVDPAAGEAVRNEMLPSYLKDGVLGEGWISPSASA